MESRILFKKGKQREFLDLVISKLQCGSLRGLLQFGFLVSYDSLKNYYSERRLMGSELFNDLVYAAKIFEGDLYFEVIEGNYGKVKGGKKSKMVKVKLSRKVKRRGEVN